MTSKLERLHGILGEMGRVLIAYSGGVDSAFLVKAAKDTLGEGVLAATGRSATYPESEMAGAVQLAAQLGVTHLIIDTDELSDSHFAANPPDRCYWCKKTLFGELSRLAEARGIPCVLEGSNADDTNDFRPGMRAAAELGVRSPLKEAGLTKAEIRGLSKMLGLPTWDKPSAACLASRFPYGLEITGEDLKRVDMAEAFLKKSGVAQVRVRHHGEMARIEVTEDDMSRLLEGRLKGEVTSYLRGLGYVYVTVDLDGYRTGSMNEVLFGKGSKAGDAET